MKIYRKMMIYWMICYSYKLCLIQVTNKMDVYLNRFIHNKPVILRAFFCVFLLFSAFVQNGCVLKFCAVK